MADACVSGGDGSGETLRQADVISDAFTSIRHELLLRNDPANSFRSDAPRPRSGISLETAGDSSPLPPPLPPSLHQKCSVVRSAACSATNNL